MSPALSGGLESGWYLDLRIETLFPATASVLFLAESECVRSERRGHGSRVGRDNPCDSCVRAPHCSMTAGRIACCNIESAVALVEKGTSRLALRFRIRAAAFLRPLHDQLAFLPRLAFLRRTTLVDDETRVQPANEGSAREESIPLGVKSKSDDGSKRKAPAAANERCKTSDSWTVRATHWPKPHRWPLLTTTPHVSSTARPVNPIAASA